MTHSLGSAHCCANVRHEASPEVANDQAAGDPVGFAVGHQAAERDGRYHDGFEQASNIRHQGCAVLIIEDEAANLGRITTWSWDCPIASPAEVGKAASSSTAGESTPHVAALLRGW